VSCVVLDVLWQLMAMMEVRSDGIHR
jgi:hypothetical protein